MVELLRNPKKLSKAQEELEQVIGKGKPVEESDIARLPYLQAIIKETFWLHLTVPFIPRRAEAGVAICGYIVPKGAQVLANAWAIGRDPGIWDNPTSFMPERFLGMDIDVHYYKKRNRRRESHVVYHVLKPMLNQPPSFNT
ncbi:geraniol 8-hydroxylase [Prunus yedoensis var. nudiflora]|uniref:Geraniol 8-hydroxylase n=1 Tax=Prunus yedoensis var. nudiflora TaxID=2094558 RepID=A0A314ZGH2_PRUYE|nr:geraniol 8-hydroxylase [Prunus yedoensis var. nudiflora]